MKTACPCCNTTYDDDRITPGMVIACARCNQTFQAFPPVELSTEIVEDNYDGDPRTSAPKERSAYVGELFFYAVIKVIAQIFAFLLGLYSVPFFFILTTSPVAAVLILVLLLGLLLTGVAVYDRMSGESPSLRLPLATGVVLSLLILVIFLAVSRS